MNDSYEILSLSAFQNKYDICMQDELIWASKCWFSLATESESEWES